MVIDDKVLIEVEDDIVDRILGGLFCCSTADSPEIRCMFENLISLATRSNKFPVVFLHRDLLGTFGLLRRPGQNNENQIKSLDNQDFLKRFQLGFDHKDENPNTNPARSDTPASESPPAPPEDSDEIFKKMKETGLIPNAVAMLDGLCKDGLVQEAMKLFGRMREKGAIPEVVIYTAVVEGFCKAHKYDDAVRIFRKMQGNGIIPNAFSYSSLIRGLCQGKRLEDALEFCLEMLEAGQSPNMTTFVGLVDGYCKEKSLEDAQSMIKAVRHKGFILDEKAVREYLDKKGPFLPLVWEAILGKKASQRQSLF
ncbi:pentatricopeptide repeat-containing protein At4g38150-like [Nicotiana sylvestris]|uniref:pentatricopeptide repeat-containing protein At4g38150-like n=1 Tax=Nicotiana sylvestris TaxID=4096 RepID=UPI00388C97F2